MTWVPGISAKYPVAKYYCVLRETLAFFAFKKQPKRSVHQEWQGEDHFIYLT